MNAYIQVASSIQQIRGWLQNPPFGLPPVNLQNLLDSLSQSVSANRSAITSGALSTQSPEPMQSALSTRISIRLTGDSGTSVAPAQQHQERDQQPDQP